MRFLKRQTINRRQLKDTTVYSDTSGANVYVNPINAGSLVLPSGTTGQLPGTGVNGMMRYNTTTNEVQVYQNSSWRSLRFKEATKIVLQNLGYIDGYSYFYGPLNASYNPSNVSSNNDNFNGQNIIVLLSNVMQIYNTNYTITQNPVATKAITVQANSGANTLTVSSTATIPTGSTVTGSGFLQSATIATVTNATTITLSKTISGGNIPINTVLTFTAPVGYYLNFTSDPVYSGLGFNTTPINVLLGFDQ